MGDITDNLFDNNDLLDILDSGNKGEIEVSSGSELEDSVDRFDEIKNLSDVLPVYVENMGTGDLDADLSNWFHGVDKIPSSPLNEFTGNSMSKLDYGLSRNTISNYSLMGNIRKFLESSMDLMFNENYTTGLSPDELEDRVKLAFTMYEKLYTMNQRTVMGLKDYKLKTNGIEDDADQMKMLLSSIPKEKLKSILTELSR